MNVLLITSLLAFPDSDHGKIWGGTTAIGNLMKYWTQEHNVLCIREAVVFDIKKCFKRRFDKMRGKKNPLEDVPEKYILDGIVTYPVIWEYTHLFQLTGGYFNHYMDRKINRILEETHFMPDVIISHMPSSSAAYYIRRIKANVPKVAVLHLADIDYLAAEIGVIHGRAFSKMRIKALDNAFDCVYTRSRAIYDKAKSLGLKKLSDSIVMSGIQRLVPAAEREWEKFALGSVKVKILYAGVLIEQKGIQKVLKAMALLNHRFQYEFWIVGAGEYEKELRELVMSLNLTEDVFFLGWKSRQEVMQYMQEAEIFIMPSYHETLGLVYLEAMSMGCITIGSKKEGIDGIIVDGQNGFLVDPYDEKDIAKTINRIVNLNREELKRISDNAMDIANTHSEEKMSEHYLNLIRKAMTDI
ncbi:MAG: glycosyltransferase family 4 protein [Lachnospiraceae bacterium]|nr:glycosyltransferase family 4 protein [Lachnospiraceae bacterium]